MGEANERTNNLDCENCGHRPLQPFIENDVQRLLYCPKCQLYQKGILATRQVYENYYHAGYARRRRSKTITAMIRLGAVTPYVSANQPRSLDVGCSVGATVQAMQRLGWQASGVDISQAAVDYCREQGLDCYQIDTHRLPFPDATFDVLSSWHVIEHVPDVSQTLAEWFRVIKPGGIVVLETPDAGYLKARWQGARYAKFWPADHLYTFQRANLIPFLVRAGFEMLPSRWIGRWTALPPHVTAYAGLYRGLRLTQRSLRLCKSLEIVCRRPLATEETIQPPRSRAA